MIFEPDIEQEDFIEFILTPREIENISKKGVVKNFSEGLYGKRNLNVFIRAEVDERYLEEEDNAIEERKEQKSSIGKHQRNDGSWTPAEASNRRGFNNGSKIRSIYP